MKQGKIGSGHTRLAPSHLADTLDRVGDRFGSSPAITGEKNQARIDEPNTLLVIGAYCRRTTGRSQPATRIQDGSKDRSERRRFLRSRHFLDAVTNQIITPATTTTVNPKAAMIASSITPKVILHLANVQLFGQFGSKRHRVDSPWTTTMVNPIHSSFGVAAKILSTIFPFRATMKIWDQSRRIKSSAYGPRALASGTGRRL